MQHDIDPISRSLDPKRQQLERRSEARRQKVMRKNPETGAFILAMSDEPTAETAFDHGESWQIWVAELCLEAFPNGVFLFNRRRGPDLAGNIDIVAVLPSGVWAVDIQRHDGVVAEVQHRRGAEGRRAFLLLDRVDRTSLLDDVDGQAAAVARVLERLGLPGIGCASVLCLIDVEASWRGHAVVGGTHVTKARPMIKAMAAGPVVLDDSDIASLGLTLDKHLPRKQPLA